MSQPQPVQPLSTLEASPPALRLAAFLHARRHSRPTAVNLIKALAASPGRVYDSVELSLLLDRGSQPGAEGFLDIVRGGDPVCDSRALREYLARLDWIKRQCAPLPAGHPSRTELEREAAFLKAEIRRSTKPRGGIKNQPGDRKKAYLRLRNALTRLIASADPELAAYLRAHLKTGITFSWTGKPLP